MATGWPVGLGRSDAFHGVYLESLDGFGGFNGQGFCGPGFGFERGQFTIAHDFLYFSQARIV